MHALGLLEMATSGIDYARVSQHRSGTALPCCAGEQNRDSRSQRSRFTLQLRGALMPVDKKVLQKPGLVAGRIGGSCAWLLCRHQMDHDPIHAPRIALKPSSASMRKYRRRHARFLKNVGLMARNSNQTGCTWGKRSSHVESNQLATL